MGKTGDGTNDVHALLKARVERYLSYTNESARQLSIRSGASPYFVGNFLRGRSATPRRKNLENLAEAMGVPMATLLSADPETPMPWEATLDASSMPGGSGEHYAEDLFVMLVEALEQVYVDEKASITSGNLARMAFREFRLLLEASPSAMECRANIRLIAQQKRRDLQQSKTDRER